MRVIYVDPVDRTVAQRDIDFGDGLQGVRSVIGGYAEFIPLATVFARHAMYVDEDARMKGVRGKWSLPGMVTFQGPAVIFGTTGSREIDATVSADAVEEVIRWVPDVSEVAAGA